ncbi:hypothetical protein AXK56_00440 [Tsukamurella pulmonis]|uniref:DUF3995 domain-containing protein n=1 Tax=Tsukamurella pulmonis TaxID=47312 RepID=A0A1H1AMZ9_9ACTN|nr:DUF3995 domain-containing protein [Tsukamurella pulmonis]KXO96054.1 hypothetical protein AXK56_00440 [Tsukamurella pulmonis]SDQ41000.1 Protein of unknown function [Tsukamurella pulmonis]SUP26380.1 Uncharacterised protein [Tsukamurella pulmonis]
MRRSNRNPARTGFVVAAVAGSVHAAFSVYWGLGGDAQLETVGSVADGFAGRRWLLVVVGAAKGVAALVPLVLVLQCTAIPRLLRGAMWAGAAALILWGAVNTASSALLAAGVLPRPAEGYDAAATVGHALLWDPLFLVWGLALAAGLWVTRTTRSA